MDADVTTSALHVDIRDWSQITGRGWLQNGGGGGAREVLPLRKIA